MRLILGSAIALALAGAFVIPAVHATALAATDADQATTQLPRNVRPTHYNVAITPDAAKLRFKGQVVVDIEVLQPTNSITLNAIDMVFSKVGLTSVDGKTTLHPANAQMDAGAQTATFSYYKPIAPGGYRLSMNYTGKIGTQASGLFAIDYDTRAGKQRALYTQFENSDARRFIPCWDEPAYKATFDLSVAVPSESALMAVSNMPISQRKDDGDGRSLITFARTPKMSTYLLFFAIGDFERATSSVGATEVGVVTRKGSLSQAAFALESSQAILREYNDYFGTPYPLPKLDNIASPGSSEFFGAMENWGAIYTFEYALLLDPTISTQSDKQNVFSTQAHEMAHQWFGDLVTMRWWDDLWLNEGFASWMESRTTATLHPEWNTALLAVDVRDGAMDRDAIATTHPVVQHVETVEQASQAFDSITYSKGEAVIRMLEGYVGADAWRDGVRRYMKGHAYGNTVTDDLWHDVEISAGKPITDIAHDFTLQPGVPMIRVESAICHGDKTTLTLVQDEFTKDRSHKAPLAWRVPVIAQAVAVAASTAPVRTLVTDGKATLQVPGCGAVIVNAGQSGYYRTLYAANQFVAIKHSFATLAPIDQLGVMNDAWALGMAGLQPVSDYLDLVQATPVDAEPQLWIDIAGSLQDLDAYYEGDPLRQARYRAFAIGRLALVFARIGWIAKPGESDPVTILRSELIATLSALDDPAVINEARRRYTEPSSDPGAMPVALRKRILAVVGRHADASTWNKLHDAARAEKTPLIKDDLYSYLSLAEDETLARRALDLSLTDEPGATNSAGMIGRVAELHPTLAFDFAIAHLAQVDGKVDASSRSRYYPMLGSRSLDAGMIDKIQAYAKDHVAASSRRDADTAATNILYRIKIRDQRLPAIDAWLQRNGGA